MPISPHLFCIIWWSEQPERVVLRFLYCSRDFNWLYLRSNGSRPFTPSQDTSSQWDSKKPPIVCSSTPIYLNECVPDETDTDEHQNKVLYSQSEPVFRWRIMWGFSLFLQTIKEVQTICFLEMLFTASVADDGFHLHFANHNRYNYFKLTPEKSARRIWEYYALQIV